MRLPSSRNSSPVTPRQLVGLAQGLGTQRRHQTIGVEPKGIEAIEPRGARRPRCADAVADLGDRRIVRHHPRHVGEEHAVEIGVGARVGLEAIGGRINRYVAREIELELRHDQARGARGVAGDENEVGVACDGSTARP